MTKEERDKFLTEQRGECWHEWSDPYSNVCDKCNNITMDRENDDFSTWEGFGVLWEWAKKQEWWGDEFQKCSSDMENPITYIYEDLINPDRFADAVYKFLNPH
ncbi:MAG: hypothetical protein ABH886_02255 [Candidatus Desantisbacteria bacterium]